MALRFTVLFLLLSTVSLCSHAQMITGIWKGRINGVKAEVKIIQKGDSLTGTSYYFDGPGKYRRYSIKGYFGEDNSVVWWDDQLIESKGGMYGTGIRSVADFNCPGGSVMKLDGQSTVNRRNVPVHLTKDEGTQFSDEWDYVLDNYTVGANDPDLIDSISLVASRRTVSAPEPQPAIVRTTPHPRQEEPVIPKPQKQPEPKPAPSQPVVAAIPPRPKTVEEKFTKRNKTMVKEIPISGDTLELRFYDNAEIDGDSITVYLNDKMIFTHVRLTGNAYSIKIPVTDLSSNNELVMVAENLGSIPPNTSYMVAIMGGNRYDATLASTENSSAMIRFYRQ